MNKKPVVGVMPLWDDEKDSIWMLPGYIDGIVEDLYKPDQRFLWAIQWHREFSYKTDENSRKIFDVFVRVMKKKCEALRKILSDGCSNR